MPRNGERGFTLIEILVVLLITAILAAIALPLFLNQREKAQDVDAKSNATIAASALEIYNQEHETFVGADAAALIKIEPILRQARSLDIDGTADGYTLEVATATTNGPFRIERTATGTTRSCDNPGHGGCPDTGHW
jgi:type IV pilus assembly protein PilA